MTRRRTEASRKSGSYNDRAERRRGMRVTVVSGDKTLFKGRFIGHMKWRTARNEQHLFDRHADKETATP